MDELEQPATRLPVSPRPYWPVSGTAPATALTSNADSPACVARQAWLALLALPLPADAYRRVLVRMHDRIIPHLTSPLLLSDFLTASLDRGAHC